jgi:hypothetical protein
MEKPVLLWQHGAVACVVTQHREAKSYELRVLADGRVMERRWFLNNEEATAFATTYRDIVHHPTS